MRVVVGHNGRKWVEIVHEIEFRCIAAMQIKTDRGKVTGILILSFHHKLFVIKPSTSFIASSYTNMWI